MKAFQVIGITPAGKPEPSLAIAASRAGGLGVLDLEYSRDLKAAHDSIAKLAKYSKSNFGIKIDGSNDDFFTKTVPELPEKLKTIIVTYALYYR